MVTLRTGEPLLGVLMGARLAAGGTRWISITWRERGEAAWREGAGALGTLGGLFAAWVLWMLARLQADLHGGEPEARGGSPAG